MRGRDSAVPGLALALFLLVLAAAAAAQSGPVIHEVAVVDQDGCPFCCEFSCRLTPTPTPAFDPEGRRVFQRRGGRFLFVVEAGAGENLRAPSVAGVSRGGVIWPLLSNGLPGLQGLSDRPLGNGSTFVECNTQFIGGVPAVPSLTYDGQASTRNAMVDLACRYQWAPPNAPCTRDQFGEFKYLNPNATMQYCFQVPISLEFPQGDTVVALRIADGTGAVGPIEEVVIRVGDIPPPPTPTPTPPAQTLSGQVVLYPGAPGIPGVQMLVNGGAAATTDAQGAYSLSAPMGAQTTVRPVKVGGVGNAVSTLDAAWALQATAGLRGLSTPQRLACDVSGNGSVSTMDASLILQRVVGLIDEFPVSALCANDWGFIPLPAAAANQVLVQPAANGTSCQNGEIRYQPLVADADQQNFLAYAHGDCTGSWSLAGAAAAAALSGEAGAGVRLGPPRRSRRGRAKIPVFIDSSAPFTSAVLEVDYDANRWRPRHVRKLSTLGGALLQSNESESGTLVVAIAAAQPIDTGDRPAFMLSFDPTGRRRRLPMPITALRATIDENPAATPR